MKWRIMASAVVAGVIGAASILYLQVWTDECSYLPVRIWFGQHGGGSETLLLFLGAMLSMRNEDFHMVAFVFVFVQTLITFFLSMGFFKMASRDGRITLKGAVRTPFLYMLVLYIVIMFLAPTVPIHM